MMRILKAIYYFFPVQLLLLQLRRHQVLLIFWAILFSTVDGGFMRSYGAAALFLSPEYLGNVSPLSTAWVGMATGIYLMSWNITTFILFSRHFRFLATTTNPFLKYCINNVLLAADLPPFLPGQGGPVQCEQRVAAGLFDHSAQFGIPVGLLFHFHHLLPVFFPGGQDDSPADGPGDQQSQAIQIPVWKGGGEAERDPADACEMVSQFAADDQEDEGCAHYSKAFIESIFNRHHISAVLSIFAAFIFLIVIGFFMDSRYFQLPAAASILVFFAILISLSGAFSYFLGSWAIPFFVVVYFVMNLLYQYRVIDPTNKAYGLNYMDKEDRPLYDRQTLLELCSAKNIDRDKANMIRILERWKARQASPRPILYLINTSGGGNRSACFTMSVLQHLDSLCDGKLMRKTFLMTGASGGMLGAAYFRELARRRDEGDSSIHLPDRKYVNDISKDLLNTLFSSFVARDLASPAQKFRVGKFEYVKDRGYAFEQQLNRNTRGMLDLQLKDLAAAEAAARMPVMLLNPDITRDSRAMVISTQPVSFLMRPEYDSTRIAGMDPDAVDFGALFASQGPMNLRFLTALRMNATFPYVLPNVWLPSRPVVDVMDAGFRDNFGELSTIRFLNAFRGWLQENTSGVVLLQIRDRKAGGWANPFESDDITDIITKPLLLLEDNWYKLQEYNQDDLVSLAQNAMGFPFRKLVFQYVPKTEDAGAALNFHLTTQEKINIIGALDNSDNQQTFRQFTELAKR